MQAGRYVASAGVAHIVTTEPSIMSEHSQPQSLDSLSIRKKNMRQRRRIVPIYLGMSFGSRDDVASLTDSANCRKNDSASYTMLYCLPPHLHDFHIAVRALNIELARIPDTVSHPTVGTMRMQFWRTAISSTLDGSPPRGQPITILLASALESLSNRTGSLRPPPTMKSWFNRLITARENRLTNPPFPTLSSLESYAESTYSTLLYLTLSALPLQSLTLDHLASHLGKSAGIIAILRGFPLIAFPPPNSSHHNNPTSTTLTPSSSPKQGSLTLPLDILARHSIQDHQILSQGPHHSSTDQNLRNAIFDIATRASDHLITARTMLKTIRAGNEPDHDYEYAHDEDHSYPSPSSSKPEKGGNEIDDTPGAFGVLVSSAIPSRLWLERLEKRDFDVFHPDLMRPLGDWRVPVATFWGMRRRMF